MRFAFRRTLVAALSIAFSCAVAHALPPGVLYSEDFEDNTADGLTVRGGIYSIGAGLGSTRGFFAQDFHNVFSLDGVPSDNVAVDLDFQINIGFEGDFDTWLNATFNPADGVYPAPGYVAMVNPAGSDNPLARLTRNGPTPGPGDEVLLDTAPNTLAANSPHHLRVERFGSDINVLLDGALIMSAIDSTYSGGQVGFRMFRPGIIDNIVVSVPEPAASIWIIVVGAISRRQPAVLRTRR